MRKIHELEGIAIETTQNKEYKEKQKVKSFTESQSYFNLPNVCVTGVLNGGGNIKKNKN